MKSDKATDCWPHEHSRQVLKATGVTAEVKEALIEAV